MYTVASLEPYPILILISNYHGIFMEIITHWEVLKTNNRKLGKKCSLAQMAYSKRIFHKINNEMSPSRSLNFNKELKGSFKERS